MSLRLRQREGRPCPSIRPLGPSVLLSSLTGKPRGGRGQTIWQMEGTIGPRGARLYPPLALCSKPPTFITWLSLQLGPKDITEPDGFDKKRKGDGVISLQTVKGTEGPVLQAYSFEREANRRHEQRDVSPFLDLCGSRWVQAAKRIWGENCTGTLLGSCNIVCI